MEDNSLTTTATTDPGVGFVLSAIQAMVADNAAAQKHVADKNADTESQRFNLEHKRLEISATHASISMKMDFALKIVGICVFSGVVIAGFVTNNMPIVTHALTLTVGVIAGVGLAKKSG